jgi:tetratricopeptide (TPR) repeat protein
MWSELKRLPASSLPAAVAKAAHYRDLNQPEEAESICHDVLAVDPAQQDALKILGLAVTDRFATGPVGLLEEAVAVFERLADDYAREYHLGVAWERAAKTHLERREIHSAAAAFESAFKFFEQAERLRPDLPDPLLRWNRCARLVAAHPTLAEAMRAPPGRDVPFGD